MINKIGAKVLNKVVTSLTNVENSLLKVRTKLGRRTTKGAAMVVNEFEPIMATELKTIKQMVKFNKTAFGVKVFDIQDKEFAKFLTDGMIKFYNKTGGQFKLPKNIIVCDLPNPKGFMMYEETKDILAISKKHIDTFQEIAKQNGETLEQLLKKWGSRNMDGSATSMYRTGFFQELFHEFGHKAHSTACKNYGNLGLDWSKAEFQHVAAKVSQYSKESPEEFVAETFSLIVQGRQLPKDVIQLYEKCGGPIIKSSGGGGSGRYNNVITDFIQQNGSTTVSLGDLQLLGKYSKEFPNVTIEQAKVLDRIDNNPMLGKELGIVNSTKIARKIAIEV